MLQFSVFFTTTACSGYKEHLFPHSYYCWRETQHIWQRWLAMMAERVPSYTGVQLSHSHYSVFGKRAFHSPPNVRKKTALLCRIFYFQRLSEEIMTGVGWIYGWAVLTRWRLRLMNPLVRVDTSGLSAQWYPCFPPGGRHWGPGKLLPCTERLDTMQRMLLSRRETFLGDQLLIST